MQFQSVINKVRNDKYLNLSNLSFGYNMEVFTFQIILKELGDDFWIWKTHFKVDTPDWLTYLR